ncbi:2-hexaprenyl-6-methoxy-1,4-benzoquinone methyltransferase [Dermatophagoides farinae]|uniref:2-methoxy-6-polyprenyl-1,4-benzoquinol methylase, mitochondrial n=1 Tax=Dermatophagoides farinae TaxID=6954 RepID=A0A922I3N4_DERFA|nr:ubie/coq5 methyltransferase gtp-binding protein-like protein [Dermatophagoides farinae]KAH9516815.1 2-hexaprenyl-6-methoxy-1,4-benzoquinone methyltransferase [Dermatophagoides farinae]
MIARCFQNKTYCLSRKIPLLNCLTKRAKHQSISKHDQVSIDCSQTNKDGDNDATNYFGFKPVSDKEKFEKVYNVFHNVAGKYDLMNDVMSFGIHRYWRNELIKKLDPIPGTRLLDVAGGTGDVAFEFLRYTNENNDNESSVIVCDVNENMLKIGQKRAQKFGFHHDRCQWVIGDAMNLPFDTESFDAYTISFGIRNVVDVNRAVQEAFRVLKPGGIFLCLEFSSQVNNPILKSVYDWYSFQIIPVMGEILLNDWHSYQYLVESIRKFPDQQTFKSMIETNGFTLVDYENYLSGVTSIHYGFKPLFIE